MKRWLIEKLGGYPDVDAALEAIRGLPLQEKHKVLTLAVRRLFNTVSAEDILKVHAGDQWVFEGKTLPREKVTQLKADAVAFTESLLWRVLSKELQYQGNLRMFTKSGSELDLVAGKLFGWIVDALNTRLKKIVAPEK